MEVPPESGSGEEPRAFGACCCSEVGAVPEVLLFDGLRNVGRQGAELVVDPGFEAGQVVVLMGEESVMDE